MDWVSNIVINWSIVNKLTNNTVDNNIQALFNSSYKAFYSSKPCFNKAFSTCSRENPIYRRRFTLASLISGEANLWTHYSACLLNFFLSSLYYEATTASWGSLGSGAQSKACKERRAVLIVKAGDHSSFRMSRHMAPVWDEILGCHILVSNFIFGGLYGYSGGNRISIWKTPPLYDVSSGP